ncbi:hypothetical protein SAMN05443575_0085 [Jatrophihabitans endophyticus]|uniref:Uncharacterized protein n=1 Tax=Jatrophihabitans endophyticus TaxID=1206085 RepID=A0A1M5C3A6_9ACTN|nr:hypothetical protein [Jatrophihabitans endophyticus]SHF49136.1 hypothetical protein SAMN05443575_0085 [Jatrophihabitans endophyticus]
MANREPVDPAAAGGATPSRSRLLTGALPVTGALAAVVAIALLASPALRHELARSFARQHESYVELYFDDERTARTCPVTTTGDLALGVTVRSHLAAARQLNWNATARPSGATGTTVRHTGGTIDSRPDAAAGFTVRLTPPARHYTATIALGGRPERLTLHC